MRTIQHTHKKLEESKDPVITRAPKSLDDRQKSRDADFVKRVEAMIDINRSKSMRSMAAELGVDKKNNLTMCRHEFALQKLQNANWPAFDPGDRRLLNSTKLLNKLKHPKESNMLWFFSDEKNFCQNQAHNRQNHRWIAMCPNDVPRVMKTKLNL